MHTTRRISFMVALVTLVALGGCARVAGVPEAPERANRAWTDRLNGQAHAAAERAQADASRQRASEAYALRLTEQARAYDGARSRERANQAWTDRLNGQAESSNAGH